MASLKKKARLKSKHVHRSALKNKIFRCKRVLFYTSSERKRLKQGSGLIWSEIEDILYQCLDESK
jgi:hypothetical protein